MRHYHDHLYILNDAGEPIPAPDAVTWATWYQVSDERRTIALDTIGNVVVSTIFLAINHRFSGDGPPLLYETMIFDGDGRDCEHYVTRQEALEGHACIVARVKKGASA